MGRPTSALYSNQGICVIEFRVVITAEVARTIKLNGTPLRNIAPVTLPHVTRSITQPSRVWSCFYASSMSTRLLTLLTNVLS